MENFSAFSAKPRLRLLLDHFSKIKDTRQCWKVAYPLVEVLFLVVCGTIAAGDDYDDIVDWGKAHRMLGAPRLSCDTLSSAELEV
jgi:DDE_Tnp_1-associated